MPSAPFELGDLEALPPERAGPRGDPDGEGRAGSELLRHLLHLKDQPVLADGFVRFRGEAVLALVGEKAAVEAVADAELPIAWTLKPPLAGIAPALAAGCRSRCMRTRRTTC